MQLSKRAIDDFKKIYLAEFKVSLSDEQANSKGLGLLNLVKLIYRPINKNENEKLYKNTK